MASYRTEALVLKKRKLGEADNVLILASPSEGRIDGIAKGVRKTTSKFGGRLEPLSYVRLVLHRGRTFDVVTSVEVLDAHELLRADVDKGAYAAVVVDVLDKILMSGQADERLVALGEATLTAMETQGADADALVLAFGVKAMAMLGLRPSLDECLACGRPAPQSVRFSPSGGGVLCSACATDTPDAGPLTPKARAALHTLLESTMAEVASSPLEPVVEAELFGVVSAFLKSHVHGRLRSLEFLARTRPVATG